MLDKLNDKKIMVCLGGEHCSSTPKPGCGILPESGPMARADNSIKQGRVSAQHSSVVNIQLKYVNTDQKRIKNVLKNHISKKTQLLMGACGGADIENFILVIPNPSIPPVNQVTAKSITVLIMLLSCTDLPA